MKKIFLAIVLFTIACTCLSGCSNRYMKSYSGNMYTSSDHCELVTAELQSELSGKEVTLDDLRDKYVDAGYEVIGISQKNNVGLNGSHRLDVESTCEKVGAQIALYDNGAKILYLRETENVRKDDDLNSIAKENMPVRKAPIVWGIIGGLLVLSLIMSAINN